MPNQQREGIYVHPSADVSDTATIGHGTAVWQQAQVRDRAVIGASCILGKGVFIDLDVRIGDRCKLENGAYVFRGITLEEGVFLGPGAMLLNDKRPRAINPDGSLKSEEDWTIGEGVIEYGASVGGGAIVLPGIRVGRWAMVGSGAVVTQDVPERGIIYGNPAVLKGFACDCGRSLAPVSTEDGAMAMRCDLCGRSAHIPTASYAKLTGPS